MTKKNASLPQRRLFSAGGGLTLSMVLAACGGSGGAPTPGPAPAPAPAPPPPPPPPQTVQGSVFLGPIEGATVFFDENGNGAQDAGETFAVSDANGQFEILEGSGDLLAIGGIDSIYGFDFGTDFFSVPSGGTILSPLTTLLNAATNQDEFLIRTGIPVFETLDPSFDVLNYSPFDPANAANGQLNDLLIFLNQAALVTVSISRAVAEVTGVADPAAFALDLIANNLAQTPEDFVGIVTTNVVAERLVEELLSSGVIDDRSSEEIIIALSDLIGIYGQRLAENIEPFSSATVRAIIQEAIITIEASIFELVNETSKFDLSPEDIFPDSDQLELEIGRTAELINSVDGSVAIATRSGGTLSGTDQGDFLRGRFADDIIEGNGGDDVILGEQGDDTLSGGEGDDVIFKRSGTGSIDAGPGDDIITVGFVDVDIDGGEGLDELVFFLALPSLSLAEGDALYTIDAQRGDVSVEVDGESGFAGNVSGVEQFFFDDFAEIVFTGTDADETLNAPNADIHLFVSGGNDQINIAGLSTVIVDFSQLEVGISLSSTLGSDTVLDYEFGSLTVTGSVERVIGTDLGDTIFSQRFPLEMELGAGVDRIFIEQLTLFRLVDFSSDGTQDILDFSRLAGAENFLLDFDDVVSRFREIREFTDEGEVTSLQFSYSEDDGFNPFSFVIEDATFANLQPENVVLPNDVV